MPSENIDIQIIPGQNNHAIGRITLNNPKALNALSLEMANAIQETLDKWATDDNIQCVLIDGAGEKAFCAGGDIQAMYHDMQKTPGGPCEYTEAFFASEYKMDHSLHTYNKPVIVWGDGIVMGGGLGIFMGGEFRIVTENSRIAMPEITIGLYPDVGASYFLNQLPEPIGRFLGLTGAMLNSGDCLSLKLGTDYIERNKFDALLSKLSELTWSIDSDENTNSIQQVLNALSQQSQTLDMKSNLDQHSDSIQSLFSEPDIHSVIDKFLAYTTEDRWLLKAQNSLRNGSPLSALIIDQQLTRSKGKTLAEVFHSEMLLSTNIVRFSEFSEGVRALLIEKDNNPQWKYTDHNEIEDAFIKRFFEAPTENTPLKLQNNHTSR